jgi:hypothetical protein
MTQDPLNGADRDVSAVHLRGSRMSDGMKPKIGNAGIPAKGLHDPFAVLS